MTRAATENRASETRAMYARTKCEKQQSSDADQTKSLDHLEEPKTPDETLQEWNGKHEHIQSAQDAFSHRARCVSAAAVGNYTNEMEGDVAA